MILVKEYKKRLYFVCFKKTSDEGAAENLGIAYEQNLLRQREGCGRIAQDTSAHTSHPHYSYIHNAQGHCEYSTKNYQMSHAIAVTRLSVVGGGYGI